MAGRGNQRGLRFFNRRMMGDVLPGHSVSIAHFCEHAAHVAVCRGGVREILIVTHILGFQTRDAAERLDDRQSGQIII